MGTGICLSLKYSGSLMKGDLLNGGNRLWTTISCGLFEWVM